MTIKCNVCIGNVANKRIGGDPKFSRGADRYLFCQIIKDADFCLNKIFHIFIPVSYTHLDVYKRQVLQCTLHRIEQYFIIYSRYLTRVTDQIKFSCARSS